MNRIEQLNMYITNNKKLLEQEYADLARGHYITPGAPKFDQESLEANIFLHEQTIKECQAELLKLFTTPKD